MAIFGIPRHHQNKKNIYLLLYNFVNFEVNFYKGGVTRDRARTGISHIIKLVNILIFIFFWNFHERKLDPMLELF